MSELPAYVSVFFFVTVIVAILLFYKACASFRFLVLALAWLGIQSALALNGIYSDTTSFPPRIFLFGVLPTLIIIIATFATRRGKNFIDGLDMEIVTWFHVVRIPVEIVLTLLFHYGLITINQTIEGTNFDMLSGITAPFMAWLVFRKKSLSKRSLIAWNVICLVLLFNIIITSILALPGPMQKIPFGGEFAFLYFPFNLLPALLVPMVLFSHLAAFRRLSK
jgi:hypothetical protein